METQTVENASVFSLKTDNTATPGPAEAVPPVRLWPDHFFTQAKKKFPVGFHHASQHGREIRQSTVLTR